MSNATQQLKAQQRRQKFADLMREMFQLNQPELDFGLYRIMHARKGDINRFLLFKLLPCSLLSKIGISHDAWSY